MKDDNVIMLPGLTLLDIPADRVLDGAKGELEQVFVCGWDNDGCLYMASSTADKMKLLWLLETAKNELMEPSDDG